MLSFSILVRLFVAPWTVARQAPLSLGFSGQEYGSEFPFPSPGDLPNAGIEPVSPPPSASQADSLLPSNRGTPWLLRGNAEPLLGKVTDSSDNLSAPASPLKVLGLWDGSQAHTTPDLWDSFPGVLWFCGAEALAGLTGLLSL